MRLPPAWLVVLSGVVIAMHVGKMPPAIPVLQQALGVTLVQAGFLLSAVQLAGMCLGLWSTYMGTGIALALLAGPLAMQALGWQGWWGLLGLLSAAMALCIVWVIPSDQTRASTAAASAPPPAADPPAAWWAPLALTLRHRGPWQVALLFALYSSQWLAVIGFLPAIYAQAGLGASQAGALTALASWINVVGNIAAGRLLQQGWCARYLLWIGYSSMGLGAVLVFGAWTQELPMLRYLAVLGFSAVGGLIPGVLFSLAVRVAPSERTVSSTVGWMQQCSSAGQFFGPPLIAWIAGNVGGWHWTWALTGSAACLGLWLARRVRFQAA